MSKAGYGTPQQILDMDAKMVMNMLHYERFIKDYEEAFIALNKESKL